MSQSLVVLVFKDSCALGFLQGNVIIFSIIIIINHVINNNYWASLIYSYHFINKFDLPHAPFS